MERCAGGIGVLKFDLKERLAFYVYWLFSNSILQQLALQRAFKTKLSAKSCFAPKCVRTEKKNVGDLSQ